MKKITLIFTLISGSLISQGQMSRLFMGQPINSQTAIADSIIAVLSDYSVDTFYCTQSGSQCIEMSNNKNEKIVVNYSSRGYPGIIRGIQIVAPLDALYVIYSHYLNPNPVEKAVVLQRGYALYVKRDLNEKEF